MEQKSQWGISFEVEQAADGAKSQWEVSYEVGNESMGRKAEGNELRILIVVGIRPWEDTMGIAPWIELNV